MEILGLNLFKWMVLLFGALLTSILNRWWGSDKAKAGLQKSLGRNVGALKKPLVSITFGCYMALTAYVMGKNPLLAGLISACGFHIFRIFGRDIAFFAAKLRGDQRPPKKSWAHKILRVYHDIYIDTWGTVPTTMKRTKRMGIIAGNWSGIFILPLVAFSWYFFGWLALSGLTAFLTGYVFFLVGKRGIIWKREGGSVPRAEYIYALPCWMAVALPLAFN